jgi:hypothetical protein
MVEQVQHVVDPARGQVVERDELVSPFEEAVGQMRADEPGAADDELSHRQSGITFARLDAP